MLLQSLESRARLAIAALPPAYHGHLGLAGAVFGLVTAWIVWRLWRFTVSPWLHPNDPPELPYWIPGTLSSMTQTKLRANLRGSSW